MGDRVGYFRKWWKYLKWWILLGENLSNKVIVREVRCISWSRKVVGYICGLGEVINSFCFYCLSVLVGW